MTGFQYLSLYKTKRIGEESPHYYFKCRKLHSRIIRYIHFDAGNYQTFNNSETGLGMIHYQLN